MSGSASLRRRIAAAIAVVGLGVGGAVATAGVATAKLPNVWGFAYVSSPAKAGIPPLAEQAGSWPPGFHVTTTPGAVGHVLVTFPVIGSSGGVAFVTAVGPGPYWCDVQHLARHLTTEKVLVSCYKAGGTSAWVPFTVTFTQSSQPTGSQPGRLGYVQFRAGSIVTQFNSIGATNTVKKLGIGNWLVTMPEIGASPAAGGVQVTAVSPTLAAKCDVAGWTSLAARQLIDVRCYNAGAAPLDAGWDVIYQDRRAVTGIPGPRFAYTINNKPLASLYAPVPPGLNFNSKLMLNKIMRAGLGQWLVRFPGVGLRPDTVLVSGLATGPGFCNLITLWGTAVSNVMVRDVACYSYKGQPVNTASLITYTSR